LAGVIEASVFSVMPTRDVGDEATVEARAERMIQEVLEGFRINN
jgi:hypothetical protein